MVRERSITASGECIGTGRCVAVQCKLETNGIWSSNIATRKNIRIRRNSLERKNKCVRLIKESKHIGRIKHSNRNNTRISADVNIIKYNTGIIYSVAIFGNPNSVLRQNNGILYHYQDS